MLQDPDRVIILQLCLLLLLFVAPFVFLKRLPSSPFGGIKRRGNPPDDDGDFKEGYGWSWEGEVDPVPADFNAEEHVWQGLPQETPKQPKPCDPT